MAKYRPLSSRKPRGRGFERREEILVAAEDLLEKRGLDTPLRDIAVAAGLSQASLFKHFASRADLFSALRERVCETLETSIHDATPVGDVRGDFGAVLRAHAHFAEEHPSIYSLALPAGASHPPGLPTGEGAPALPGLARLKAALAAHARPQGPPLDLLSLSFWFTIYGMALTVAVEFGRDRLKAEETISTFLDILAKQLAGLG